MKPLIILVLLLLSITSFPLTAKAGSQSAAWQGAAYKDTPYRAEVSVAYDVGDGLPSEYIRCVCVTGDDRPVAGTGAGLAWRDGGEWRVVEQLAGKPVAAMTLDGDDVLIAVERDRLYCLSDGGVEPVAELNAGEIIGLAVGDDVYAVMDGTLHKLRDGAFELVQSFHDSAGERPGIKDVCARRGGDVYVVSAAGLFHGDPAGKWRRIEPADDARCWAMCDARGVTVDATGGLWAAAPQGVARQDDSWDLYTGYDGLPYNDFTCVAAAPDGAVWFGTSRGAVKYDGEHWAYRQGKRWLPDDHVRDIAVDSAGNTWFATPAGVGCIELRSTTLAEKARFFDAEIDKRHKRTPYGYVDSVRVKQPGDKSEWTQHDSDNDGLWTGMYGAAQCFAYAATGSEAARKRAKDAFEALRFLRVVTQGGEHPAPPGFVARTILPTSGPDPNKGRLEEDRRRRETEDKLWKVIDPRWPKSEDGKWYWKCDTSSDELDGHYFFYAQYYDLVAETEKERNRVREHVRAITDHLVEHDFNLVDWDGKPTRWARFGPQLLNHDPNWWVERGLNSLSILSYLKTAEHITGDSKYGDIARDLVENHGYAMNVLYPKVQRGPGSGNQSDDEMAFMCYYNLLKYEIDPELREIYAFSLHNYHALEAPELNPFFNFICAARASGAACHTPWGTVDLTPGGPWLEQSVETLRRYPRDRFDWALKNSHRIDIVPLPGYVRAIDMQDTAGMGYRRKGLVLPIDERFVNHWSHDPWRLDHGGDGRTLADGASFLLPYCMGLYHGFIKPDSGKQDR